MILIENTSCVHSIWWIHINEVSGLRAIQRNLEITSQQSYLAQRLRTGSQRLGVRQLAGSAGSIRNIKFTLPIGPVQAIETKSVEIDEASGPRWRRQSTSPNRSHAQILMFGTLK